MKNIKLFNVIFPIWFLLLFPMTWLVILPANYIIDSIALLISLSLFKVANKKKIYKKTIFKIWIFGFIADMISSAVLYTSQFLPNKFYDITSAVSYNPFENIFGVIYVILAVIISGYCIYIFNMKYIFRKIEIGISKKIAISVVIAILTAPYAFLIPTSTLQAENYLKAESDTSLENFIKTNKDTYIGDNKITRVFEKSSKYFENNFKYKDINYEIDSQNRILTANVTDDNKGTIKDDEYSKWSKFSSFLTLMCSKNGEEVIVNLYDSDGNPVTQTRYTKEDFEKEYKSVELTKLADNIDELSSILY